MNRLLHTTAAVGLALLAAAAPAAAQTAPPPHVPVPAGQLQHTVTVLTFPKRGNTFHHDTLRNERWIGASAGRELVTDVATGRVREDCQYTLKVARCWAAPLNLGEPRAGTLTIFPGNAAVLQSWADAGAGVKSLVGDPRGYHVTGSTTFLGRPATTLAQDAQRGPDGGIEHATVIAEADNWYPLFRDDVDADQPFHERDGRKGVEQVEQVTTTKVMEVLAPAGVKLTIGRHPHARVLDERPAAVARRRAARRPKPAPKRRPPIGYAAPAVAVR
jgi:hypothetical protein